MKKAFFITFAVIFLFLLFVVITEAAGVTWSNKVRFQSVQGDYVKYDGNKYCLNIYKQQGTLNYRNIILISRKGSDEYGFYINYPFSELDSDIEKTKVLWTNEGIEITFSPGHKLYIPKDRFIGGR